MDRFIVHIGGRALEIVAPSSVQACQAAMEQYPGEIVSGYGYLGPYTPEDAPSEDAGRSGGDDDDGAA